jgi:hypothetical protein
MRAQRLLGVLLVLLLGVGLAACGGDDGGDDDSSGSSTEPAGDSADSDDGDEPTDDTATDETVPAPDTGEISSVEDYCEAVDAYVQQVADALENPEGVGPELTEAANELATQAGQLALDLSPEDNARLQECSLEATQALTGG